MNCHFRPLAVFAAIACALLLSACSTTQSQAPATPAGPQWTIYDAQSGQAINWATMTGKLFAADVILVGEEHTNAIGHELELRLVEDLLRAHPGSAIAMEMFERHEQVFVDLYLDGEISTETLVEVTHSANWAGKGTWQTWYQPIVDAVKAQRHQQAALIAANAPREYARLARMENYDVLDKATLAQQPALALRPSAEVDDATYHDRFVGMMSGMGHGDTHQVDAQAYLRAQRVWDATMADSVIAATAKHSKVMLIVGDFHIASQGGTLQRIRHHAPQLKVVTLSIIAADNIEHWNLEDRDRADFVIYTAK